MTPHVANTGAIYLCVSIYFKHLFSYISNRQSDTGRDKDLSTTGSVPKWQQWPGMGQADVRSQELYAHGAILHHPLRGISREEAERPRPKLAL